MHVSILLTTNGYTNDFIKKIKILNPYISCFVSVVLPFLFAFIITYLNSIALEFNFNISLN